MSDRTQPTPEAGDEPTADEARPPAAEPSTDGEPIASARLAADGDGLAAARREAAAAAGVDVVDVGSESAAPDGPVPVTVQPRGAADQAADPPKKKGWPLSSLLLLGLAAALAVLSILLYTGTVRLGASMPPPPDATPGAIRTVDVVGALRAQGLTVEPDQKLFVPRREFTVPGQGVKVGESPLLVFIFPDPAAAKAEFAGVDPANVLPATLPGGVAAPADQVMLAQGSNIAVALVGGDEDTRAKVTTAIEGLP